MRAAVVLFLVASLSAVTGAEARAPYQSCDAVGVDAGLDPFADTPASFVPPLGACVDPSAHQFTGCDGVQSPVAVTARNDFVGTLGTRACFGTRTTEYGEIPLEEACADQFRGEGLGFAARLRGASSDLGVAGHSTYCFYYGTGSASGDHRWETFHLDLWEAAPLLSWGNFAYASHARGSSGDDSVYTTTEIFAGPVSWTGGPFGCSFFVAPCAASPPPAPGFPQVP